MNGARIRTARQPNPPLTQPLTYLDLTTAASYGQSFAMGDGTLEYKLGNTGALTLQGLLH